MERDAWEFDGRAFGEKKVSLADEEYVTLFVGKLKFARIFASPKDLRELGAGFLVTEGVADFEDIESVKAEKTNVFIELKKKKNLNFLAELRSSGCAGAVSGEPGPLASGVKFESGVIISSLRFLDESSGTWRRTGGTHAACLVSRDGKLLASFEDVGRHNTLDKAVGWALLNGVCLDDKFILFSGRISTGIVYKSVRAGIPLLASNTAGLSRAVESAGKLNLSTAGFARKDRFTVYTHKERII